MKIHVSKVCKEGSCNYCDKSTLRADQMGLDYPYDEIVEVKGKGIKTRFCFDCFKKVVRFKESLGGGIE